MERELHGMCGLRGLVAALLLVAGCQLESDPACRDAMRSYEAVFSGSATGGGLVRVQRAAGDDASRVDLQVIFRATGEDGRPPGPESPPFMQLRGQGSCLDGTIRAHLGSATSTDQRMQVLGGSLVAVLRPEVSVRAFGHWRVELVDRSDGAHHQMAGYFSEREHAGGTAATGEVAVARPAP